MWDADATGWKRHKDGHYWKVIGCDTYHIFRCKYANGAASGWWYLRRGNVRGSGYVGEWKLLAEAERAAHKHAEENR